MLRIGEELPDHFPQAAEVIGDEQKDPVDPAADQILEDLDPEALVLPALERPEPKDFLVPLKIDPTATNKEISSTFPPAVRSFPGRRR